MLKEKHIGNLYLTYCPSEANIVVIHNLVRTAGHHQPFVRLDGQPFVNDVIIVEY
jgi:hypothetical protein